MTAADQDGEDEEREKRNNKTYKRNPPVFGDALNTSFKYSAPGHTFSLLLLSPNLETKNTATLKKTKHPNTRIQSLKIHIFVLALKMQPSALSTKEQKEAESKGRGRQGVGVGFYGCPAGEATSASPSQVCCWEQGLLPVFRRWARLWPLLCNLCLQAAY